MNRGGERLKIRRLVIDEGRSHTAIQDVLERHGHFAHGGNPERAAEAWAKSGFEAPEVDAWLFSRCFVPEAARDLADVGLTPELARAKTSTGRAGYVDTIGFKVAEGDLAIDLARALAGLR
jgi:hypothetical protein